MFLTDAQIAGGCESQHNMDKEKFIAYSLDNLLLVGLCVVPSPFSETIVHIYIYSLYQVLSDPATQPPGKYK